MFDLYLQNTKLLSNWKWLEIPNPQSDARDSGIQLLEGAYVCFDNINNMYTGY